MVSRRQLVILLGALALSASFAAVSQPAKIPRIGWLQTIVPQNNSSDFLEDFRRGLRDLGYVEGKNIQLEVRWGEGKLETLPALAAELVRLKVDVIVAVSSPCVLAAKEATRTIPIVMPLVRIPSATGSSPASLGPAGTSQACL